MTTDPGPQVCRRVIVSGIHRARGQATPPGPLLSPGSLPVPAQEAADAADRRVEVVGVREGQDPEVVGRGQLKPVPCTTWIFSAQQQVEHELLVVVDRVHLRVEPREGVQRALRLDAGDAGDLVELLPGPVALLVEPAAGRGEVAGSTGGRRARPGWRTARGRSRTAAWRPASSGPRGSLRACCLRAGDHQPAGAEAGHAVRLRQPAEGEARPGRGRARRPCGARRRRRGSGRRSRRRTPSGRAGGRGRGCPRRSRAGRPRRSGCSG